nr:ABC transporter ATP-binding protein [Paenibacillus arenosi]
MLLLAGETAGKIKLAFVLSFVESLLSNVPIFAVLYIFTKILDQSIVPMDAWFSGGIMLAAVIVRCILRRIFVALQSGTGYDICARERISIGDRFKRFPMSYFTEGNKGSVTSAVSIDLLFIEEHGMGALDKVINGYISIFIGAVLLFVMDWRIALVSLAMSLISLYALEKVQLVGKVQSKIRQHQQASLTSAVLEYVQGISVIKAFNISGDRAKAVKDTIERTRDHAIDYEEKFTPPSSLYQACFSIATALIVLLATVFCYQGSMDMSVMLMLLIYVFYMYIPVKALSTLTSQIRVMEAGLNRYEKLLNVPIIDKDGRDIALNRFDIEFNNVTFAYAEEQKAALTDISFTVPEKSMTALVGVSGSGKSTIANLIVRFWDVQQGEVLVGGVNVKEMTCDSLLKNMSMVFQKVYLFNDTIMNNIKFGKADATFEEVVAAAKRARCHDFIMALEKGYDTVVGEGGSTLSGGEKQRVSIARAILKDAPIVLLDEATASVDPDNEKHIQLAINELVKNKTLVIIAHRLSTIRNADQILVIDNGTLAQQGTHDELMKQGGHYRNLWDKRSMARSWKINAAAELQLDKQAVSSTT